MVEWLGRYAQIRGIGPICPRGEGLHWDDQVWMLGSGRYHLNLLCKWWYGNSA